MSPPSTDYFPPLLARLRELQGNGDASRQLLEQAAQEHAGDPRVLLLLGAERVHASDVDGAEAAYIAALQVAPGLHIARFQLGLLQLTGARPAAALSTWAPLQALDQEHPLRLFASGLACLARDEHAEARRLLELGIARNRENEPLNRDMRMVLERMAGLGAGGDGEAAADPAGAHYLVSNYQKS